MSWVSFTKKVELEASTIIGGMLSKHSIPDSRVLRESQGRISAYLLLVCEKLKSSLCLKTSLVLFLPKNKNKNVQIFGPVFFADPASMKFATACDLLASLLGRRNYVHGLLAGDMPADV